jgi:acyl carrier protein
VARGYVNQKELTKERFLPDPFHPENFMYRTGDMAKWLPQGVLDFTGRKDSQVKLRGQRIELEEIEFTLAKYQKIKQVVVGIFGKGDDKVICAWYLAATTIDDAELISFLKNHLPSYMIPSHFIYMDAFPVTVSGKINRKELLLTGNVESKRTSHQTGDLEKALASAFGSVLNKDLVNPNISFFDLGGNSIKAIYLTSLIQKELRVKVPLAKLYEFPSVIELSTYVRGLSKEKSKEHIKSQEFKRKPFYPLSASQQRVYLSQIKDPDLTAYNMPFTMSLDEEISAEDVRNLIQKIIQRHECFRLSFQQVDGVPKQFISDSLNFSVEHINEEQLSYDEVVMNFVKPFDLTKAPLLRATIFSKGNNRKLLVDIHHIIFDGSSMQILQREFDSLVAGKNLEDIHHSYIDHIEWLNSEEYSKAVEVGEQFWLQKFGSTPKVLDLPTDYARGSNSKGIVKPIKVQLSKQITDQLKVQSGLLEVSSFHFTFAVFNLLLAKLTNQSDITVGVPVSGRSTIQMKNVVGMFVNYLPMRTKIESDVSFSEFVQNLKAQTIQSLEHQDYPYDLLVDKLNLKRVSDHNPLFDVVFNYFDNNEDNSNDDNSAEDESVSFKAGTKVDLLLFIMYRNNKHMMRFEYDPSLYKRETMEFISSSFINMIEAACLDPQQPVSSIGMRNKTRISQKDLLSTDLR